MIAEPATLELAAAIHDQTYPIHPSFPQLKMASDLRLMLELFREHLKPADSSPAKALQIDECVPVRFGFRRNGKRCGLQYALRLGKNDPLAPTGSPLYRRLAIGESLEREPLADCQSAMQKIKKFSCSSDVCGAMLSHLWVTCVIYADAGEAAKVFAERGGLDHNIPDPWRTFEPITFIPELQMLLYVFPCDRAIPRLRAVLGGMWPELEERLLACFGQGPWQMEHQTTEPLRYRTEDSAVVRYTLRARCSGAGSETQTRRFYAKVNRTRYGRDIYQLLQHIRNGAAVARNDFGVVEPVFYCNERRCLVLAEASGRSLQDLLQDSHETLDAELSTALRNVARAMSAFNQAGVPTTVRHSAEEQIRWLNRTVQLLCWACPLSSEVVKDIAKEVTAGLTDVPHAPIQWDIKPDHVFLDGERVIFIDLDTVSFADPARDPAHLAAHIACRIDLPHLREEVARAASRVLIEEYFAHVPASWRAQLKLQYAIAVLEAASGLFKRQEPGWPEQVPAAIEH